MRRQYTYPISNPISTQRTGGSISVARLAADSLARDTWGIIFAVSVTAALPIETVDLESGGIGVIFCDSE